jgi:hypothetical protein
MTEPPSAEKVLNTYRKVTVFYSALEKLAAKYEAEDNKGRAALAAIGLTVRFLQQLNVDRSLLAAFVEAQLTIERDIGGRTAAKQRVERNVVDSVAVELQRRCGVKLEDAIRNIVGNDPKAAQELRDFRKNVRAGRNVAAQTYFDNSMKSFRDIPPQAAMKKALRVCANLRGKKV